jgi:hypothetical protein
MWTSRPVTRRARRAGAFAALTISFSVLSACAHQDLTAPCTRDGWLSLGSAYASDCGVLRPVNPDDLPERLPESLGQGAATP